MGRAFRERRDRDSGGGAGEGVEALASTLGSVAAEREMRVVWDGAGDEEARSLDRSTLESRFVAAVRRVGVGRDKTPRVR